MNYFEDASMVESMNGFARQKAAALLAALVQRDQVRARALRRSRSRPVSCRTHSSNRWLSSTYVVVQEARFCMLVRDIGRIIDRQMDIDVLGAYEI